MAAVTGPEGNLRLAKEDDYVCWRIREKRFVLSRYDCDRALSILMQGSVAIDDARSRRRYVRFDRADSSFRRCLDEV